MSRVIIEKDFGDKDPLSIDVTNTLEAIGVELKDVNDIYFGLKASAVNADDYLFLKTIKTKSDNLKEYPGGLKIEDGKILVPFDEEGDFTKLKGGSEYLLCLAIEKNDDGWFKEVGFIDEKGKIIKDPMLKIVQDKVRR